MNLIVTIGLNKAGQSHGLFPARQHSQTHRLIVCGPLNTFCCTLNQFHPQFRSTLAAKSFVLHLFYQLCIHTYILMTCVNKMNTVLSDRNTTLLRTYFTPCEVYLKKIDFMTDYFPLMLVKMIPEGLVDQYYHFYEQQAKEH